MKLKLTEEQMEYVRSGNGRVNIKTGGVGSGKTFIDLYYSIPKGIVSLGNDDNCLIVGASIEELDRNIISPMRELWGGAMVSEVYTYIDVQCYYVHMFGRRVMLFSAGDDSMFYSTMGLSFKYAYGDNVHDWSEEMFLQFFNRRIREDGRFDITSRSVRKGHLLNRLIEGEFSDVLDVYHKHFLGADEILSHS